MSEKAMLKATMAAWMSKCLEVERENVNLRAELAERDLRIESLTEPCGECRGKGEVEFEYYDPQTGEKCKGMTTCFACNNGSGRVPLGTAELARLRDAAGRVVHTAVEFNGTIRGKEAAPEVVNWIVRNRAMRNLAAAIKEQP